MIITESVKCAACRMKKGEDLPKLVVNSFVFGTMKESDLFDLQPVQAQGRIEVSRF